MAAIRVQRERFHASSKAFGVVSVDGSITTGDMATVTIEDRSYNYTVVDGDTLSSVRDNLINQINNDPKVIASPASLFTRIVLQARVGGPEGEGIAYTASAQSGASIILTALTPNLCCASREGDPVTDEDPARPGELISVFATGLGFVDRMRRYSIRSQARPMPDLPITIQTVRSMTPR